MKKIILILTGLMLVACSKTPISKEVKYSTDSEIYNAYTENGLAYVEELSMSVVDENTIHPSMKVIGRDLSKEVIKTTEGDLALSEIKEPYMIAILQEGDIVDTDIRMITIGSRVEGSMYAELESNLSFVESFSNVKPTFIYVNKDNKVLYMEHVLQTITKDSPIWETDLNALFKDGKLGSLTTEKEVIDYLKAQPIAKDVSESTLVSTAKLFNKEVVLSGELDTIQKERIMLDDLAKGVVVIGIHNENSFSPELNAKLEALGVPVINIINAESTSGSVVFEEDIDYGNIPAITEYELGVELNSSKPAVLIVKDSLVKFFTNDADVDLAKILTTIK